MPHRSRLHPSYLSSSAAEQATAAVDARNARPAWVAMAIFVAIASSCAAVHPCCATMGSQHAILARTSTIFSIKLVNGSVYLSVGRSETVLLIALCSLSDKISTKLTILG